MMEKIATPLMLGSIKIVVQVMVQKQFASSIGWMLNMT